MFSGFGEEWFRKSFSVVLIYANRLFNAQGIEKGNIFSYICVEMPPKCGVNRFSEPYGASDNAECAAIYAGISANESALQYALVHADGNAIGAYDGTKLCAKRKYVRREQSVWLYEIGAIDELLCEFLRGDL